MRHVKRFGMRALVLARTSVALYVELAQSASRVVPTLRQA